MSDLFGVPPSGGLIQSSGFRLKAELRTRAKEQP